MDKNIFKERAQEIMDYIRFSVNPGDSSAEKGARAAQERSKVESDERQQIPNGIFIGRDVLEYDKRDMNTYSGAQGGYLVENQVSQSYVDSLENAMLVKKMGARVLTGLVGDLSIPRKDNGATAYWIDEGEDITESDVSLGQINLRLKSVGAFVDVTRKLIKQSSLDVFDFIMSELMQRIGLAVDLASINGNGIDNEPLGILQTTGIGSVTLNAQNAPDWGDIVDLESAVAVDNALLGRLAYSTNATIVGNMKQTLVTATYGDKMIMEGNTLNGYPCYSTGQVPAKHIVFGDWSSLIIAEWGGLDLNIDTATLSKSGGIRIVAIKSIDVAVRHAESFADGYHV